MHILKRQQVVVGLLREEVVCKAMLGVTRKQPPHSEHRVSSNRLCISARSQDCTLELQKTLETSPRGLPEEFWSDPAQSEEKLVAFCESAWS